MKKHGFTLAEVLITLGIIGVVSALVIPTFTAQTQSAKIGPRVGKAISSFEQATKALIEDNNADSLAGIDGLTAGTGNNLTANVGTDTTGFLGQLSRHLKGGVSTNNLPTGYTTSYAASDGVVYYFNTTALGTVGTTNIPHQNNYINRVMVDVNGTAEPNRNARDRFYFSVAEDGSLVAWGSAGTALNGAATPGARTNYWNTANICQANQKPGTGDREPSGDMYCAGHVVENGMKAFYK